MFGRKADPKAVAEYKAAKKALRHDPVNNGSLGAVDIDSPEARANLAAQDRVRAAERNLKASRG